MISLQQIFVIIAILLFFAIMLHLLKRKMIEIKYSVLWIITGFVMLVVAIFPQLLTFAAKILSIKTPAYALFAILFFFILLLLMSLTSIVSRQAKKIKSLTQSVSMMEKRLRELENK